MIWPACAFRVLLSIRLPTDLRSQMRSLQRLRLRRPIIVRLESGEDLLPIDVGFLGCRDSYTDLASNISNQRPRIGGNCLYASAHCLSNASNMKRAI